MPIPAHGYRRAFAEMVKAGYRVSRNYVQKLWREAGLKVPYKKKRRKPRALASGWQRPLYANVTWAMDFQFDQSQDKRSIKLLNVVDEYGRRWLASLAARSIDAAGVITTLDGLVAEHGVPKQLRMDIHTEFRQSSSFAASRVA